MKTILTLAWLAQSVPVRDEDGVRVSNKPGTLQKICFKLWILPLIIFGLFTLLHLIPTVITSLALAVSIAMLILLFTILPEVRREIRWELDRWINRYLVLYSLSIATYVIYLISM